MVDKEKNTNQKDQNSTGWSNPKEQQSQKPVEPTDQEQQGQELQSQEQQNQQQQDPKPQTKCVKKDPIRDKLERKKWTNQVNKIESKCNQSLSDCHNKSNDDSLKLLNDVEAAVSKYRDDYEKLNNQLECMKTNNEAALKDVPDNHKTEINEIITAAWAKINELKSCKEKLECPVNGKSVDNGDCNYDDYPLLTEKPEIGLGCSDSDRQNLRTLMTAKDELARSYRYHDAMESKFIKVKSRQTEIEENLKKIAELQTKAQKAKEEGKLCQFYAYTLLMKIIIDETNEKMVKVEDLNALMSEALEVLIAAKVDKCYREYTNCKLEAMNELINKSLEEAKKNRDEDILKKIVSTRT